MHEKNLSLLIEEGHPAYEWAKKQSDSVSAFGHIGTHIDCYDSEPEQLAHNVETVIINCTESMPSRMEIESLELANKALILFTGNVENNGYGTPAYGALDTAMDSDVLDCILAKSPSFIVIDSYGIGAHGNEHIAFDKRCESRNCFVIENVMLSSEEISLLRRLKISFDKSSGATGKRCLVIGVFG